MGHPIHALYPPQSARDRFGMTLSLWLERGGWSHDVPMRWGKAAGFPAVADSTFNRLQNAKIEQPYPITFIQLGLINKRLSDADYGLASDDPLLERLARQRPITHDDGSIWDAMDFFGHFIGEVEAPDWARTRALPSLEEAVEASDQAKRRFQDLAAQHGLALPEAWESFAELVSAQRPPSLSPAELNVLRNVLAGWHVWTPQQLHELTDLDGVMRAGTAVEQWAATL